MKIGDIQCEVCGVGPDDAAMIRQNKGHVPPVWRCMGCNTVPVDGEIRELIGALSGQGS